LIPQATAERLSTLFQQALPATTDRTYIDTIRQRWEAPALQAGFLPLAGTITVGELPSTYRVHPLEYWHIERVSLHELSRFSVPSEAREKLDRAYALGVPVKWLLWAEQHVTSPKITYRQETIYVVKEVVIRRYDPALIALIKGGNDMGIPYLVHCWLHT
jgi:hypothetical protein